MSSFYRECALACILTIYSRDSRESFPPWILIMVSFCSECKEEAGPPVKDFSSLSLPLSSLSLFLAFSVCLSFPTYRCRLFFPISLSVRLSFASAVVAPLGCRGFTSPINHEEYSRPPWRYLHGNSPSSLLSRIRFSEPASSPAESWYRKRPRTQVRTRLRARRRLLLITKSNAAYRLHVTKTHNI